MPCCMRVLAIGVGELVPVASATALLLLAACAGGAPMGEPPAGEPARVKPELVGSTGALPVGTLACWAGVPGWRSACVSGAASTSSLVASGLGVAIPNSLVPRGTDCTAGTHGDPNTSSKSSALARLYAGSHGGPLPPRATRLLLQAA